MADFSRGTEKVTRKNSHFFLLRFFLSFLSCWLYYGDLTFLVSRRG